MSNEKERGKLFSESVDRLISGQEVRPETRIDPELDSALDFARKMTGLRAAPSPLFSARLKEKLLRALEKQQVGAPEKEKGNWLSWFVSHKPVWQAATAVFVIMAVIGISWAAGVFDSGPVPVVKITTPPVPGTTVPAVTATARTTMASTTKIFPTTAAATVPATARPLPTTSATVAATTTAKPSPTYLPGVLLAASASTGKTAYLPGETVNISYSLRNVSLQPLILEKLPPIVSVMQTDTHQPVYTFRAGTDSLTLAPGETTSYTLTWNQFDFNNRQVSKGSYYVEMEDLDYQGKAIKLSLSTPVRFDILPPEAMSTADYTLTINESQNAGGITITLQKAELFSSGLKIFAFVTPPPDYTLIPGASGPVPARNYSSQANYAINGGWMQEAGSSSINYFSNGMNYSWFLPLEDMASARELVFFINRIGIWNGPWQFNIALK